MGLYCLLTRYFSSFASLFGTFFSFLLFHFREKRSTKQKWNLVTQNKIFNGLFSFLHSVQSPCSGQFHGIFLMIKSIRGASEREKWRRSKWRRSISCPRNWLTEIFDILGSILKANWNNKFQKRNDMTYRSSTSECQ